MSIKEEIHSSEQPITTKAANVDGRKMKALQQANKERLEIVTKYAKGEDSEGEDDHWEDSAFKVYKITDRYGFLHETELSEIPTFEEERRKRIEVQRQYKWLKMLQKWKYYEGTDKLRSRVFKGIPLSMRGDAWRLMLNVEDFMRKDPRVYDEMKERAKVRSPDIRQIDLDVKRTYRNHIMFRTRYSIKQRQLFHVLAAYSMYNTEVGYCQGMSQIAALLLMYMSEEEAFWALHSLLYGKKHRMHGFFIPGFPKLIRFQEHHDKILKKFLPRLKKHLDKNEVFASLYTMKWFFQCFLDRSPFPLTLRLWDAYVLEGERILVAMSYTTLKMHKTIIKKMEMDEVVSFLQESLAENFGADDDAVIELLKVNMAELKRTKMSLPTSPGENESARIPFGLPVKPTFEQETGIRVPLKADVKPDRTPRLDASSKNGPTNLNGRGNYSETNGSAPMSSEAQRSADTRAASSTIREPKNSDDRDRSPKKTRHRETGGPAHESVTDSKKPQDTSPLKKEKGKTRKESKEKKSSEHKVIAKEEKRKSGPAMESEVFHPSAHQQAPLRNQNPPNEERKPETVREKTQPRRNKPNPTNDGSARRTSAADHVPTHAPHPPYTEHASTPQTKHKSNGSGKLVWKTPSPTKIFPSHQVLDESNQSTPRNDAATFDDKQIDKTTSTPPNTKPANQSISGSAANGNLSLSPKKPQNKNHSKHKNRSKSNKTEANVVDICEAAVALNTVQSRTLHGHQLNRNKKLDFNLTRPYSAYDNVKAAAAAENEDGAVAECNPPLNISSPTSEPDNDNPFQTMMEESLVDLCELAAGLSCSPGRLPLLPPSIGFMTSGLEDESNRNKSALNPPRSLHDIDVHDEDTGSSSLGHVIQSLSNWSGGAESKEKLSPFEKSVENLEVQHFSESLVPPGSANSTTREVVHPALASQQRRHGHLPAALGSQHPNPRAHGLSFDQHHGQGITKDDVSAVRRDLDFKSSSACEHPSQCTTRIEEQPKADHYSGKKQNISDSGITRDISSPTLSNQALMPPIGRFGISHIPQPIVSGQQYNYGREGHLPHYSRHVAADREQSCANSNRYMTKNRQKTLKFLL